MADLPTYNDVEDSVAFHDSLNPRLWEGDELIPEVHETLLRSARAFCDFIDMDHLEVIDIILCGSNAAYNYTVYSDLDVHLIVDFDTTLCPALAENFFHTKKSLWNATHAIKVRGHDVEMYVEDTKNPVKAAGVYSLMYHRWETYPEAGRVPSWDDTAILTKMTALAEEIDTLLDNDSAQRDDVVRIIERLHRMRKGALAKGGEFSTENLVFKALRNLGYLDRLYDARRDMLDQSLSLESKDR
jgi:hypothetical protein